MEQGQARRPENAFQAQRDLGNPYSAADARAAPRAIVLQQKNQRPVQFEITAQTREALETWIKRAGLKSESFLFPSRISKSPHLGTRQYARIVDHWVSEIGLDPNSYGTHSMRR